MQPAPPAAGWQWQNNKDSVKAAVKASTTICEGTTALVTQYILVCLAIAKKNGELPHTDLTRISTKDADTESLAGEEQAART